MKKHKLLAVLLALVMTLSLLPTAALAAEGDEGELTSMPDPIDGVITLEKDVNLSAPWVVREAIVLNLNGHTIKNSTDIWNDADNAKAWSLISVQGGNLTINGSGTLHGKENDCFAVDIRNNGQCTINGGTYKGNIAAVYVHDGHLTVNGGTFSVQQKSSTQPDQFVLNCLDANYINGSATIKVTGGSFAGFNPADCEAEGKNTNFVDSDYKVVADGSTYNVVAKDYVAQVNGTDKYESLSEAFASATDGQTVTLLNDVNITSTITVSDGKNITLDMNDHNINATPGTTFKVSNGGMNVTGSGTITAEYEAFRLAGNNNATTWDATSIPAELTVGTGVTVISKKDCCVFFYGKGAVANVYGSLTSKGEYSTIQGNGTLNATENDGGTVTNIYTGAKVEHTAGMAIYSPQVASTLNMYGGTISGATTGVELRAGTLNISGGSITTTATSFSCDPNGNGSTTEGAAIAIAQHTTKQDIVVNISGGTFKGVKALNESNPQANDPAPQVALTVSGGTFNGDVSVTDATKFITGGTFSTDPKAAYLADGYVSANVGGSYVVGTAKHTVTFESNGGTTVASETVAHGVAVTEPAAPTKTGYNFAGWYSDSALTTPYAFTNAVVTDVTLYADWTPVVYTITYDLKGGTLPTSAANPTSYTAEDTFTLVNPTRNGYTFTGWTLNKNTGLIPTVTIEAGKSFGPITFTANWSRDDDGYTGGGGGGGSSSSNTTTTTEKNADGSTTTTTTDKTTGTVTETTKNTDGSTTTVETKKDGTVTETNKTADGTTGTVVTDKDGDVTSAKASVSTSAAKEAAATGDAVTLPVEVPAVSSTEDAPTVQVSVPKSAGSVKVEIPVEKVTPGTVAVIVNADGTEKIVSTSVVTENGVVLTLDGSATVKVIDNSKDFADVPASNVFYNEISSLSAREIMIGKTEDTFDLYNSVTLNQIANVAGRITGAVEVSDYAGGIAWGAENGLKTGDEPATRGEVLKALYVAAGSPAVEDTSILSIFNDSSDIPADMAAIAAWAAQNGILKGTVDGKADLGVNVTRGQACALAGRAMNTLA